MASSTPTSRRSAGPDLAALLAWFDAAGAPDQSTDYGIAVDILPPGRVRRRDPGMAVAELAQPLLGLEPGRRSFAPRGAPSSDRPIRPADKISYR
jgi:hypothetical protein